jgi:hypothetical protein
MKALRTNISTTCSKVCEALTRDSFILGVVVLLLTIFMASQGFAFRSDNDELFRSVNSGENLDAGVLAQGDFNDDGVKDLVIGQEFTDWHDKANAKNCIEVRLGAPPHGLNYPVGDPDFYLHLYTSPDEVRKEICSKNYTSNPHKISDLPLQ